MKLILLGAPGAGKGTVAKLLTAIDGSVQISTGDILRGAVQAGNDLGKEAEGYMKRGDLVPDSLIMGIMGDRLQEPDCANGFLLDGFPRTIPQAEALTELLTKLDITLDKAVNIAVPKDIILDRLCTRRTCENSDCQAIYNIKSNPPKQEGICDKCGAKAVQREDETEEAISHRLATYNEKTAPLIGFYEEKGLVLTVEAVSSDAVIAAVKKELSL
jgi:adenylate kinase